MTNLGATAGRDFCGELLDDRYRVESRLGVGGMATVYLATDERLGRQVVIKAPLEIFLTVAGFRERFAQEIQALIRLDNPFIGKILDRGEVDGLPYAVLQYLAGGSLKDRVDARGGTLTPAQISDWMPQVARAVDFIHSREFLHRDIKPGNILFDADGNVYLADFGIAKVLGDKEFTNLTQTGTLPGTVAYMAPEAGRGGSPGPAYDQYALAVVVYQALSGDLPHEICETPIAGLVQKITQNPMPLEQVAAHLPIGVCNAVMKALRGKPDERFASCGEFARNFVAGIATDPASALIEQKMPREPLDAVQRGVAEDPHAVAPSEPAQEAEVTIITGEQPTDVMAARTVFAAAEQTIITADQPAADEREADELVAEEAALEEVEVEAPEIEEPAPADPEVVKPAAEQPMVAASDQPVIMPDADQFAPTPASSRRWQMTRPTLRSWKLPTVSLPRVDISEWRASLAGVSEMKRRLLIGAGVTLTLVVVILLVMTFMADRGVLAQQIAALEEAVQSAIDSRDWDTADQELTALAELAPSNVAATGWRRIIDDRRRIERTETLRAGIVASIVRNDWDAAAARLTQLREIAPEHPQLETFRQRISEGNLIAPMTVEAPDDVQPPAEQTPAPQQTTEPQPGPAEDQADDPVAEEPQASDDLDPQTADDPRPAEENPPAAEAEAEPAPVGETRAPRRISAAPPDYPAVPFALAIEGAVTVQATINVDGDVATATVQDSLDPFLDAAAINAVLQWKYEPALVNGTPREFPLKVTVTFALPPPPQLVPPDDPQVETARQLDTIRIMTSLVNGIDRFRQANNAYPEVLADLSSVLQAVPEIDSWDTPFWYQNLGEEYWLVSFGRDAGPGPAPPSTWDLGAVFAADIRVHSGDFEQNPAAAVADDPGPPEAVGGINPVPLTDEMTAPVLDPQSVDNIVVDRQVQNVLGLITRRIRVYCLVVEDGSVVDARVLQVNPRISLDSADRLFRESTRQSAIASWRFSPAMRDGEPVPVWVVVTITYEPRR